MNQERGIYHISRERFSSDYLDGNKKLSERLRDMYPTYKGLVVDLVRFIDTPRTEDTIREIMESRQRAENAGLSSTEISRAVRQAVLIYPHWLDAKHDQEVSALYGKVLVRGGRDAVSYLQDGSGRNQLGYIQSQPSDNRE